MTTEVPILSGASEEAAAPVSTETLDPQPDHSGQSEQAVKQVPLAALESERAQRQKMQDELTMMKEHLNLVQARQQQSVAPPPQDPTMADDDVMTFGEFKKVATEFKSQISSQLDELQMAKAHTDYDDVVQKYLPEIVKNNPKIGQSLRQTQDFNLAYYLAKTSDSYRRDHAQKTKSADAERLMANSEQSGNLSSVGGTSPISMAKRYKDMSDTDFRKEMAKNVGYS